MCKNRALWKGLTIFLSMMLVLLIIISLIQSYLNKYSTYNLLFNRLPELVTTVNTSTSAITAILPPEVLAYNTETSQSQTGSGVGTFFNESLAELRKTLLTKQGGGVGQTIGENWLKNKKIAKSTKLVDALKDNTNAVKKESNFLAGGTNEALSDAFMGQLLCLSFISIIGDTGDKVTSLPVPGGNNMPSWLLTQKR